MKITRRQLKQLIKEEMNRVVESDGDTVAGDDVSNAWSTNRNRAMDLLVGGDRAKKGQVKTAASVESLVSSKDLGAAAAAWSEISVLVIGATEALQTGNAEDQVNQMKRLLNDKTFELAADAV